jgi:O-6-methylguanine DNA methyltransferase
MDFESSVYAITKRIAPGTVTTYGKIAAALGLPNHSRHVGAALRNNPYSPQVPCHRVVKADGQLGGFFGSGNGAEKAKLLLSEGVMIDDRGRVLKQYIVEPSRIVDIRLETSAGYLKR